ncbi:MAG: hypothetical protein MUF54_13780, partial [Polyangiaceae bacterium]|nr:hypothetical protein [Polyangiaceae bacterium]
GYVVLTSARACPNAPGCPDPVEIPWYVRLSSTHEVTAGAPMLLDALQPSIPAMVWSPGCTASRCMALAAGAGKPTQVVTVTLPEGEVRPGVPARGEPAPSPPWVESNDTVRVVDGPLSALAATQLGPTTFFASITHFVEGLGGPADRPSPKAPGNPSKPTAARLDVLRLDAQGRPLGEPTVVSVRAMSVGGVALAPAPAGAQEVCVAWVARDFGDPQVFLTRVGVDGKTKLQRMLTRERGDASDVAIAAYKTGYSVAWVDWRDGNGEVYATLVNQALLRTGPEVRLTNAPGDASDVSLLVRGEEVVVAYGDPRDDAGVAAASPYVQKLTLPSLARAGSEVRVQQAHDHAKGVSLLASGEDIVLAWNEDALADVDGAPGAGPRLGRLDAGTLQPIDVAGVPIRGAGTAAALGLTCSDGSCRGAITVRRSDVSTLDAFSWSAQGPRAAAQTIARLNGASGVEVAPALAGDAVLFVDQGLQGGVRARRAAVRWTMP